MRVASQDYILVFFLTTMKYPRQTKRCLEAGKMAQQLQAQTALAEAPALISRVPVSWLTGPVTPAPGRWTPVASRAPGFMCTNALTHLKKSSKER